MIPASIPFRLPTGFHSACALGVLASSLLVGCVSTDPREDIDRAAETVAARAGVSLDWSCPWEIEEPVWDGVAALDARTAVEAALQANRSLRRAILEIAEIRADVAQSKLLPNPVLSVAYGLALDGGSGDAIVGSLLTQLDALWTRSTRIATEEARLRAKILSISDLALELVARVRSLHGQLVHAERALRQEEEAVGRLREADRIAREAFEDGLTTVDVQNVASENLAVAERRRAARSATLRELRRSLLHALGRAEASADFATDNVVTQPRGIGSIESLEQLEGFDPLTELALIERARLRRLDVAAALATLDVESRRVVLSQLARIPSTRAGVGYERNLEGREGLFPRVQIEIPIFDTGEVAETRARATRRRAGFDAERVLEDAVHDVRRARVAVEEGVALREHVARERVALASRNAESAAVALENGIISRGKWLQAEGRRLQALADLEDAEAELAVRLFDLERAVGGSFAE